MFSNGFIKLLPVNILPIIPELLLHLEKVTIPDFGTFSIVHQPAQLNKLTGILLPPSKSVLFDHREQTDNQQLSDYVARRFKIKNAEAAASVGDLAKSLEEQLASKVGVIIEGVGNISRDNSGSYQFKPLDELISRVNIFGLPKLEIQIPRPASSAVTPIKVAVPDAPVRRRKHRRWWIPAALITLVAGLSAFVYLTGLYERFQQGDDEIVLTPGSDNDADRLVFGNRAGTEADTMQENISREIENRTVRERALLYEEPGGLPEEQAESAETESVPPEPIVSEKPYHIIAGSFLVPNNANRQKTRLEKRGFPAALLPRRGNYYMVSLGSYDSHKQAVEAMKQLREKLEQDLWVMKI